MNILKVDYQAKNAPVLFAQSLRDTGFSVITNHGVAMERINKLYMQWTAFFNSDTKQNYLVDPNNQEGYVPPDIAEVAKGFTVRDLKEFYNFYPWGKCPAELRDLTLEIQQTLKNIAVTLLHWLQQQTPDKVKKNFSMPLPDMLNDSKRTLFRLNYYPPLTGSEEVGAVRAAAHGDINLLTVLTAATQSGLQAQDTNGEWYDVPCDPGNLVINAGDMLQECSDGYYCSTTHRVLNPFGESAKKSRMSCPLFLHPQDDVVLSERHTAKTYLHERLVELGLIKQDVA
ncbi:MAG: isopenicillin N synthase family oxygenase [Gammaproteobacteria bacterium]|nr:isopenicillin N synthase family oxygenase [Gammaproteobacteria bacterium]